MKIFILFFSLAMMFGSASAFAADVGGGKAGFIGLGELTTGLGTSGSETSIKSRSMLFTEAALRAGYRMSSWFAPMLEGTYRYVGQSTSSSSVSDTNMGGSGYLLGAGLNFDFSSFSLTAMYDFSGSFSLAKETSGGSKLSYTSPQGFRIVFNYKLNPMWDAVLTYSDITYHDSKTGSTTTSLSSDLVKQSLYGIGIAYKF